MRKGIGVVCIIFSVLLIIKGHDVANSFASKVKLTLEGVPVDAAMRLYLVGAVSGLLGLLLIFWKR